jgi:hypothetical protein
MPNCPWVKKLCQSRKCAAHQWTFHVGTIFRFSSSDNTPEADADAMGCSPHPGFPEFWGVFWARAEVNESFKPEDAGMCWRLQFAEEPATILPGRGTGCTAIELRRLSPNGGRTAVL